MTDTTVTNGEVSVVESFPVYAEWIVIEPAGITAGQKAPQHANRLFQAMEQPQAAPRVVRAPEVKPRKTTVIRARKRFESDNPMSDATVAAVFRPIDEALEERAQRPGKSSLMLHMIYFKHIGEQCPIFDREDAEERCDALIASPPMHFIRLNDDSEFITLSGKGVRFLPGKRWIPPENRNVKKKSKKKSRAASVTRRRTATVWVNCVALTEQGEDFGLTIAPNSSFLYRGDKRFNRILTLDYEYVSKLKPGDVLNPADPLTKAYDPRFSFLQKDEDGFNALTNFGDISIPLFWPDWEDSRLDDVRMLESWTERSYAGIVHFLEGMHVNSLDDFLPSDTDAIVESLPSGKTVTGTSLDRERKGQCYHGEYASLSIIGPFFLFRILRDDKEFFILDCPFYGVALRAFWDKDKALAYVSGGEARQRAEEHLIFKKIPHDPNGKWEDLLERRIVEHVCSAAAKTA